MPNDKPITGDQIFNAIQAATALFAEKIGAPAMPADNTMVSGAQVTDALDTVHHMMTALNALHDSMHIGALSMFYQSKGEDAEVALAKAAREYHGARAHLTGGDEDEGDGNQPQGFIGFAKPGNRTKRYDIN